MPARPIETIVLKGGQKERLVEDLGAFFLQESDYAKLGVPWHRGYLLHGPPGTGKTSIARALADRFGLDVYYIPLRSVEHDNNLIQTVARVQPGSMLLLEDIDDLYEAMDRGAKKDQKEQQGVSLSGLLNVLDGVATPHGLVTIMTTNRRDVLDDALVRAGRVDLTEEVSHCDERQLRGLWSLAFPIPLDLPPESGLEALKLAPGDVVEILKTRLGHPEDARAALTQLIAEKTAHAKATSLAQA